MVERWHSRSDEEQTKGSLLGGPSDKVGQTVIARWSRIPSRRARVQGTVLKRLAVTNGMNGGQERSKLADVTDV